MKLILESGRMLIEAETAADVLYLKQFTKGVEPECYECCRGVYDYRSRLLNGKVAIEVSQRSGGLPYLSLSF